MKLFVLDLDGTILKGHTGGVYDRMSIETLMGGPVRMKHMQDAFRLLTAQGDKIFINTRGRRSNVIRCLSDAKLYKYVTEVYSARDIDGEYTENTQFDLDSGEWALNKLIYIGIISSRHSGDIYFYDDTRENVVLAQDACYRSIHVTKDLILYLERHVKVIDMTVQFNGSVGAAIRYFESNPPLVVRIKSKRVGMYFQNSLRKPIVFERKL